MVLFNFRIGFEALRDLKGIARELGLSVSDILREALAEWMQRRGYAPAAVAA